MKIMIENLQGYIESITYTNKENGYTIARVRAEAFDKPITIVGNMISTVPGESLFMKGEWESHPRYGRQFKVSSYRTAMPAVTTGIEKYLASGLIRGIGVEMARRIVNKFGEKTLEIIDNKIEKLTRVEGIGKKRLKQISEAWNEQKEIREVMIFLESYGISPGYASKIFKRYGKHSVKVVTENPYRLAMDIFGIGFATADKIAENMGFGRDSEERAKAGLLHVLNECTEEGHVCYPSYMLIQRSQKMLQIDREIITTALEELSKNEKIVLDKELVYLPPFYVSETGIASSLIKLQNADESMRKVDSEKALKWVQQKLNITFAVKQKEAVKHALKDKILVITGGPGTGKTTIIKAIIAIASRLGTRIVLAAPTGRAAKRMSEATGFKAKTIHRLLEYNMHAGGFQKNDLNPLQCDLLILDEASMIDTILMHHLLKAVPANASLIMIGDVNQLPSVGAGNVLKDIIASGRVAVVELNEIFRQARESRIIVNAHRINVGLTPEYSNLEGDFYFIEQEEPEKVVGIIIELVKERIPRKFHLDPVDDIQVLSPMHRGLIGVENLNQELQNTLNPGKKTIVRGNKTLKVNDKVMQIRNNYNKDVFNGDMGRILRIEEDGRRVTVSFDGHIVDYESSELDEIALAYAVSVHKSQGSEYPAVVIPVMTQHYMLLQRNLLYTAVTRGEKLVVLVGSKKALNISVKNDKTEKRYTKLAERLK